MQRKMSRRRIDCPKRKPQAPAEAKLLVDEHELARVIGMSVHWLRKDRRHLRVVPFVKLASRVLYHLPAVQSALLARMEGGLPQKNTNKAVGA